MSTQGKNNNDYDDLTKLGNIGKKRQIFIRDNLNVKTYEDLYQYSTAEIAHAFKSSGKPYSIKDIKTWLSNAHQIIDKAKGQPSGKNRMIQWEWLKKIFIVHFRVAKSQDVITDRDISVHHIRVHKDGTWEDQVNGKLVPLGNGDQMVTWMLEQLDEKLEDWSTSTSQLNETKNENGPDENRSGDLSHLPPSNKSLPKLAQPIKVPSENITITSLEVFQPVESENPVVKGELGGSFTGSILAISPFALVVNFKLGSCDEGTEILAKMYVKDANTTKTISLGSSKVEKVKKDHEAYSLDLKNLQLPPGNFQLGVLVHIRSNPPHVNYLELPGFQVIKS